MNEIEIRANLNFDEFRQGKFYRTWSDNSWVQALVWAGYFTVTNVMEVVDESALDRDIWPVPVSGPGVGSGMVGPEETD